MKLQNLLKKLKQLQKKPELSESQLQSQNQNLSPNLLDRELILKTAHYIVLVKALKKLNLVLFGGFILVLAANIYINHRLDTLVKEIPSLYSQLTEQSLTFDYVTYLNDKTVLYKEIVATRAIYHEYTTSVLESRFPGVELVAFKVKDKQATLEILAETPISPALLISRLLSHQNVAAVAITAAELNQQDNTYKVAFELELN